MLKVALFIIVLYPVSCIGNTATCGVVFFDDFEADAPSNNASLLNWDVSSGTVDVSLDSRKGGVGWTTVDGNIVDLDGSSSNGAIIRTKDSFSLTPGEYTFSFKYSGSNDPSYRDDTFSFGIDTIYSNTFLVPYTQQVQVFETSFTVTQTTSAKIYFDQDAAADNYGIFIDAVRLEFTVPEPSTAIAMGLLGIVGFAGNRRRRRQESVA